MKKYAFLVFMLALGMGINAQTLAKDKALHLGAGVLIGGVGGYAAYEIFDGDPYWTWAGAVGSSLAAGLLKEKIDENEYGGWDNKDLLFTVVGGAISGLALDLILKNKRRRRRGYTLHYDTSVAKPVVLIDFSKEGSHNLAASLQAQKMRTTSL